MHMMLQSNYKDLVDSCRDAGLVVEEHPTEFSGISSASVWREHRHVGGVVMTGSFGKATLCMDLHQNKMSYFVALFRALETRERNCL